ncbi:LOW QUALITY PROTEIN: uncharacterized protein LOC144951763 [Lampetra fluviatilis]
MSFPGLGCASMFRGGVERGGPRLDPAGSPSCAGGGHGGGLTSGPPLGATAASLLGLYASPYGGAQALCGYVPYAGELHGFFPHLASPLDVKGGLGPGLVSCGPAAQPAGLYGLYPGPAGPPPPPGCFSPYGLGGEHGRPKNATRESTATLKAWLGEHRKNPYPTKGEKIMLAIVTRMTLTQVSTWFANARRRLKKETRGGPRDADDLETSASDDGCSGGRGGEGEGARGGGEGEGGAVAVGVGGLRDPERPPPGSWTRRDEDDDDDDDDLEIDLENSDGEQQQQQRRQQQQQEEDDRHRGGLHGRLLGAERRRASSSSSGSDDDDEGESECEGRGGIRGTEGRRSPAGPASPVRAADERHRRQQQQQQQPKPKIWSLAETAAAPDAPRGALAPLLAPLAYAAARPSRGFSAWEAALPRGPGLLQGPLPSGRDGPRLTDSTITECRTEFLRVATP